MHRLIFFIALSLVILSCSKSQKMTETHKYTNHLIHENSPYLLQHAHNPVDWHPWNEAALEKEAFFFEGQHRSLEEVVTEFRAFAPRMQADMDLLEEEDISYEDGSPYVKKLDKMSLSKYLK